MKSESSGKDGRRDLREAHSTRPDSLNAASWLLADHKDQAPALLAGNQRVTHGELREQVEALAAGLQAWWLDAGDLVGIVARNSLFSVVAYLGVIMAGLVAVPIKPDDRPESFNDVLKQLGLRHLLISKRFLHLLDHHRPVDTLTVWTDKAAQHPLVVGTLSELQSSAPDRMLRRTRQDDLAALMLTSGSTGQPKAVMVTHGNIEANTRDIASYLELTPADRVMVILPFHYCFGTSLLHSHLLAGGSVVLNNGFTFPETVLDDMEAKEVTNLAGVPSTYQMLLRRSSFRQRELPSVRFFQQAGGKLPNTFIKEILEAFPGVAFYKMYGQTEATARLSYLPPDRLSDKLGSIGRGLPSTKLDVLKEDGESVVPGSDEVGEIVASGPNITAGYFRDPEETARFFKDGRLWTGDLAQMDEDGFIYIVGRKREFIKPMGHRVSPLEVESVLAELPEIVEVGVFGVPDDVLGEKILALVVAADMPVDEATIVRHCRASLPEYAIPAEIRCVPDLPKNDQGKLVRSRLRDIFDTVGESGGPDSPRIALI